MKRINFIRTIGLAGVGLGVPGLANGISLKTTETLPPLLVDQEGNPIVSVPDWEKQRDLIKKSWLDYLGALDPNPKTPVLKVLKEDKPEGLIRQYVEYEGEPGIMVRGYLLKPGRIHEPLPAQRAGRKRARRALVHRVVHLENLVPLVAGGNILLGAEEIAIAVLKAVPPPVVGQNVGLLPANVGEDVPGTPGGALPRVWRDPH